MANIICRNEGDEVTKYIVDVEKLPELCYTNKKDK